MRRLLATQNASRLVALWSPVPACGSVTSLPHSRHIRARDTKRTQQWSGGQPFRLLARDSASSRAESEAPSSPPASPTSPAQASARPARPTRPIPQQRPGVPPRPSRGTMPPGMTQEQLEVVRVENAGDEAWAGIASIDRGVEESEGRWRQVAQLVAGDGAVLLLFIAIGRAHHGESLLDIELFTAAVPFLVGWYTSAALLGGYSQEAMSKPIPAAVATAKTWALSMPLSIGLRSAIKGYLPGKTFAIITAATTFTMMLGWRTLYAYLRFNKEKKIMDGKPGAPGRQNKKGNPFEFFRMISGLTRRW